MSSERMTLGQFIKWLQKDDDGKSRDPDMLVKFHTDVRFDMELLSIYDGDDGSLAIDID